MNEHRDDVPPLDDTRYNLIEGGTNVWYYYESMENNQRHTFRCLRCGFVWFRFSTEEKPKPSICPKCNSPEWNKSKKIPASNSWIIHGRWYHILLKNLSYKLSTGLYFLNKHGDVWLSMTIILPPEKRLSALFLDDLCHHWTNIGMMTWM